MLLGDFGTTWTKIIDTSTRERKLTQSAAARDIRVDVATGHNLQGHAPIFVNELLALASGGIARLGPGPWTLVDIGSRDIKAVSVDSGRPVRMDWNNACGALTGFTLELLGRYFDIDFKTLKSADQGLPVTCGVLGMERLFDKIAAGSSAEQAVAAFVRGMASFAHSFLDRPELLYLSGGMCDNALFLKSFPEGVRVEPLGRFLLVEGLEAEVSAGQLTCGPSA
jgi:activator of 2-hydroxyglutaryl-CoA dehydratase